MSLGSYAGLLAAVPAWLDERSDLEARIPEFVALCEAKMNRRLRSRGQVSRAVVSASGETAGLPADVLAARSLRLLGGSGRTLEPVSAEAMSELQGSGEDGAGEPRAFCVEGTSLVLWPAPQGPTDLRLTYYAAITPAAVADNWLIAAHPDAYLYGTVAEGWSYLGNNEEAAKWAGLFIAALDEISASSLSETMADRLTPQRRAGVA